MLIDLLDDYEIEERHWEEFPKAKPSEKIFIYAEEKFPEEIQPGKYCYKNRTLYISVNKPYVYSKGSRISKKNRLIFLTSMMEKKCKAVMCGNVCRISIFDVSQKEKNFLVKFIKSGYRIKEDFY